jgi:hypothetical protein
MNDHSTSWSSTFLPVPGQFNTYDSVSVCFQCDQAKQDSHEDEGYFDGGSRWDDDPNL